MATNLYQDGDVIQYTNGGTAIDSGDPVPIGGMVGVAAVDIANGASGSVNLEGVYLLPKTAGNAWTQGQYLYFDVSAGTFSGTLTPATGDVTAAGIAWAAAGSADTTGYVKLRPGILVT